MVKAVMGRPSRKHTSIVLGLILIIGILGLYYRVNFLGGAMGIQSQRIDEIFKSTNLVCFGRFLMELPATAKIIYGDAAIDGNIRLHKNQAEKIDEILTYRLSQIEKERGRLPDYLSSNFPLVGNVREGAVSGQKTVFGIKDSVSYRIHSYIPLGQDLLVYDSSAFPEEDEIPFINNLAGKLRSRADLEIPVEPGICLESAFVALEPNYESISIGLRFADFPDVHISIDARKNRDYLMEGSSLKEMRDAAKSRAEANGFGSFFSRIKVLREAQRQLGKWEGEEILTRRPVYKDDTDAHEFRFFSLGGVNDPAHPMLDIQLDSGVRGNAKAKVTPSITDEEAMALWDRILPTIRLRQPSDATTTSQIHPKIALGSFSKSGDKCPQSGWWKCVEKGSSAGDRRRKFEEGSRMPPVLISGGGTLWQRLVGDTNRVAIVNWELLEYEDINTSLTDFQRNSDSRSTDDGEGARDA